MWTRILFALLLVVAFVVGWNRFEKISIQVVGQPTSTGVIQQQFERPFFENLASTTGLPLEVSYIPNDELGIKDTYQLLMLKSGALELVSIRFLQNAVVEPMLLGLDLSGATSSLKTAHAVADAYAPILDQTFQEHYNSKLLGLWPFGPQVFFCRPEVRGIKDLKGLKIRVGSENFRPLISSFGANAVVIPFEDVKGALRNGLVDCAITSATSGNAAGWPEHTHYFLNLGTQMGINGYAVSLSLWNRFSPRQQARIEAAFKNEIEAIWDNAEQLHQEMSSCNVGGPCKQGIKYRMVNAMPSKVDRQRLHEAFQETTFKDWANRCDRVHPGCSERWRENILPILQADSQ